MVLYKYHGAGNDFLIADGRKEKPGLDSLQIASLCDRRYGLGADGLMVLESREDADF
ncbi:diaminopimelate epimerase, partial [gut metagenome]